MIPNGKQIHILTGDIGVTAEKRAELRPGTVIVF